MNCPFYVKIGACRHGDRCSRQHNKPLYSQTVVLEHMYVNPMSDVIATGGRLSREQEHEIQERFLDFYEDVFLEVSEYGEVSPPAALCPISPAHPASQLRRLLPSSSPCAAACHHHDADAATVMTIESCCCCRWRTCWWRTTWATT